jgi:DNA-binding response OmpR family regulator
VRESHRGNRAKCAKTPRITGRRPFVDRGIGRYIVSTGVGTMEILLIEDDEKLGKSLEYGLESEGFTVTVSKTGEDGFFLASHKPFDLVLLDIMLPGRDGFEVLCALREMRNRKPIIVLTANDRVADRIHGLNSGADDYLVKPFAFPELLARTRALLCRGKIDDSAPVKFKELELDVGTHEVRRSGALIGLTVREFEILEYLLRNQGQVVSREMLARDIWKEAARYTPLDNVIDVHIARLRRKVDDNFSPKLLHIVRGLGFILREEVSDAQTQRANRLRQAS